jgi:hypothetical protein
VDAFVVTCSLGAAKKDILQTGAGRPGPCALAANNCTSAFSLMSLLSAMIKSLKNIGCF